MANIFCWLEEKWGSVGAYLQDGIGFTYTEQKKLRRVLSRKKHTSSRTRSTRYTESRNDTPSSRSNTSSATMRPSRESQRERRTSTRQSETLRPHRTSSSQTDSQAQPPPLPKRPHYDGTYSPRNTPTQQPQQSQQPQQQQGGPPPPIPKRPASVYGNAADQLNALPPVPTRPVFPQQQLHSPPQQSQQSPQPQQQSHHLMGDCGLPDTAIEKTVFLSDILRDTTHAQLILFFKFCGPISLITIDRYTSIASFIFFLVSYIFSEFVTIGIQEQASFIS